MILGIDYVSVCTVLSLLGELSDFPYFVAIITHLILSYEFVFVLFCF